MSDNKREGFYDLVGKTVRIYVKNLTGKVIGENFAASEKPIVYSCEIESVETLDNGAMFLKFTDRAGATVRVNIADIIQVVEVHD